MAEPTGESHSDPTLNDGRTWDIVVYLGYGDEVRFVGTTATKEYVVSVITQQILHNMKAKTREEFRGQWVDTGDADGTCVVRFFAANAVGVKAQLVVKDSDKEDRAKVFAEWLRNENEKYRRERKLLGGDDDADA